jgi:hypothetical protein
MSNPFNIIKELRALFDSLDEEDFEFDVESNIDVRSINTRPSRGRRSDRRKSSAHDRSKRKNGRDKFEARRKIKKINRLLQKAERKGLDPDDIMDGGDAHVDVRVDEDEKRAVISVEGADPELDCSPGEDVVVLRMEDGNEVTELPFAVESVERTSNNEITTFTITGTQD